MKEEKKLLLQEIEEKISASQGFILLRYLGFTAAHSREFRNSLSGVSAEFEVLKKRIFFKAIQSAGFDIDSSDTSGHLGVVFAYDDAVSAAKQVLDFNKQHNDSLVFLAGRIDSANLSGKEVEAVAKLPSMKELRQQIVGLLAAPMSQVVGIMGSALSGVISCIDQKTQKN
ncbi:50S ribosomal protein L10 [Chlamydia psittaci]|uniref:50S ribosomal protein L10 n=1 Tax=Chlamydia psittaci TaxID=83554 RepID=UPI0001F37139|nr:50S ribosomal protein L10 [Chlamydia psittaci]AFS22945.1 ribosomal L10 family protein [Chlamydia psittaci VS225]EPJ16304.1 ribosomal L10 family protein [Chlamydia psittaci 02DC18]EPJ17774.1 ribosomal L10 family protein [Chlamydia psittaci 02DC22]EPJ20497.1 ribosomal L10 family protein [Chlamydia psittaci 02DC23]EPJ21421.1 ribosomal L10 family protein [Chlamydia psittaci 02DC21]EPJ21611.1 ribosomal L10 family protein [Chlamydia psittaci 03DC29]EPL00546.1 ribosomal L10 family protein [Chlam